MATRMVASMAEDSDVFVVCFCEEHDLLSQWRGYAKGRGGFAIGFSAPELQAICSSLNLGALIGLFPVTYDRIQQRDAVDSALTEGWRTIQAGANQDTSSQSYPLAVSLALMIPLTLCFITFKKDVFKEEREWRIVVLRFEESSPSRSRRLAP